MPRLLSCYIDATNRLMERHGLEIFSEHLAFHRVDGNDLTVFLPMPFEEDSVSWVKRNYEAARERLGRPFALENVTYPPEPCPRSGSVPTRTRSR